MGKNRRGKRDGTGPYKFSYARRRGGGKRGRCYLRRKEK